MSNPLRLFYGSIDHNIDITEKAFAHCKIDECIVIPSGDALRASLFTDPHFRTVKKVFVIGLSNSIQSFDHTTEVCIDTIQNVYIKDTTLVQKRLRKLFAGQEMKTSCFMSGYEFYKLAKWSVCPRYPIYFEPSEIRENDIVFLNLDYVRPFLKRLREHPPMYKFVLIAHNSDKMLEDADVSLFEPFVKKIYGINTNCSSPIVQTIPIGFVDDKHKSHAFFANFIVNPVPKEILLYMNFSIQTNIPKRSECLKVFQDYSWVTKQQSLPAEGFYTQLIKSKYVLSPEGTGVDCHRIYESIYLDAIPIVKTSILDSFYKTLPVVIVSSWEQVTEQYLLENYEKDKKRLDVWKKTNEGWYTAEFWLR